MKLHNKRFIGEKIPLGAKVFFKLSSERDIKQDHKFDPNSIPGVFAGYVIGTGITWSRKYKVWALSDFANQNLGFDANHPIKKLLVPHITEKLVMVDKIVFPLKAEYEKLNGILEGIKVLKDRGGAPDAPDVPRLPNPGDPDKDDDDEDKPPR